jgi:predicted methyltransferase
MKVKLISVIFRDITGVDRVKISGPYAPLRYLITGVPVESIFDDDDVLRLSTMYPLSENNEDGNIVMIPSGTIEEIFEMGEIEL